MMMMMMMCEAKQTQTAGEESSSSPHKHAEDEAPVLGELVKPETVQLRWGTDPRELRAAWLQKNNTKNTHRETQSQEAGALPAAAARPQPPIPGTTPPPPAPPPRSCGSPSLLLYRRWWCMQQGMFTGRSQLPTDPKTYGPPPLLAPHALSGPSSRGNTENPHSSSSKVEAPPSAGGAGSATSRCLSGCTERNVCACNCVCVCGAVNYVSQNPSCSTECRERAASARGGRGSLGRVAFLIVTLTSLCSLKRTFTYCRDETFSSQSCAVFCEFGIKLVVK